jgi:hypothetical protein
VSDSFLLKEFSLLDPPLLLLLPLILLPFDMIFKSLAWVSPKKFKFVAKLTIWRLPTTAIWV